MKLGTKTLLFGVHQFAMHPWFVAWGWYKLYGFPFDPRLWIAFIIHDWGYFGKPNLDGLEGAQHPVFAAKIMTRLFGSKWGNFCKYHSRKLAKLDNKSVSRLCYADKMATVLIPIWLFLVAAKLSGELTEYLKDSGQRGETGREWFIRVQQDKKVWVAEQINKITNHVFKPSEFYPNDKSCVHVVNVSFSDVVRPVYCQQDESVHTVRKLDI